VAQAAVPITIPATVTRPPIVVVATQPPTATPTATHTPLPTETPTATATASPVPTATPDRTIACSQRVPPDDLLTVVTLTYGLSRDYAPGDLVPLADYVSSEVTLGYPTEVRRVMAEPLATMIAEMQAAGLQPTVISGYRSYSAQAIARQKWLEKEPERVDILSAPPGFSEHQLGTVVDFGSPDLAEIVGQEDIEFHTWFYKTGEGQWLLENAHRFGFTLSYSREAQETTGFFYEPWHYRYVGVEMATRLKEAGRSLTEYQLSTEPPPCVPDSP
jgi:D-alanyl-D-alanine carboxypeptidase